MNQSIDTTGDEERKLILGLVKQYDSMKTPSNPEGNPFFPRNLSLDEVTDGILALLHREKLKAVTAYIQPHLDYCQEQNGMPYCKNCGLAPLKQEKAKNE